MENSVLKCSVLSAKIQTSAQQNTLKGRQILIQKLACFVQYLLKL